MALADRMRPKKLEDIIGQEHILSEGKILRTSLNNNSLPNIILYGPTGCGKTSFVEAISEQFNRKLYKLNGVSIKSDDIRQVLREVDTFNGLNGVTLFIDELSYLNVKQQQLIIDRLEDSNDKFRVIGATMENPSFYIHRSLLSRCLVVEFKKLTLENIISGLLRAVKFCEEERGITIHCDEGVLNHIAIAAEGDLRRAINLFEVVLNGSYNFKAKEVFINLKSTLELTSIKVVDYDINGTAKYDQLSAFQKSVRGSDVDAALFYLGLLIKSGDLNAICRRLACISCEDVFGQAVTVVSSCISLAQNLGLPEARLPLAHATIYLTLYPKSNSVIKAIDKVLEDIDKSIIGDIPKHLQDNHYKDANRLGRGVDYKYPHDYKNNYVKQQYLPDELRNRKYFEYGNTKYEQSLKEYWDKVKK